MTNEEVNQNSSKDESLKFVGPNAGSDFGHASAILNSLKRAENIPEEEWRGNVSKSKVVKEFQETVRRKVANGELTPDALIKYNIPPEEK
jgi:hypothetical protein